MPFSNQSSRWRNYGHPLCQTSHTLAAKKYVMIHGKFRYSPTRMSSTTGEGLCVSASFLADASFCIRRQKNVRTNKRKPENFWRLFWPTPPFVFVDRKMSAPTRGGLGVYNRMYFCRPPFVFLCSDHHTTTLRHTQPTHTVNTREEEGVFLPRSLPVSLGIVIWHAANFGMLRHLVARVAAAFL